ncbi:hypothetical protein C0J52_02107 [Blattella germanica]|nr:hypothetical protein C0J52_02107 [Blattella germanica]
MAMVTIYCLCGQPYDANKFMIQCDVCKDWFHGSCVGLKEYLSYDLDKYHCPHCQQSFGPSVFKQHTNCHRHNYSEPDADNKPVQTGTAVFIKELKSRHFPSACGVVHRLQNGNQLTIQYMTQTGFNEPIIVEDKSGLDLVVPPQDFSVKDVENYIGSEREVDVIDVARQTDIRMKLGEFIEYFTTPRSQRTKTLNVISLEFSHTSLSSLVEAPYVARKLDWVNFVWPSDSPDDTEYRKPEVQKYCLMGVEDSYTDFHIDFGGSSVWYHVLRVDKCYKCTMNEGETMLIPTGWIHAVLTPVDSLVFGGNFLHSLNISTQLQIYDIEKKIHTPEKFRFPAFETTNWYAARSIANDLREMNNKGMKIATSLLTGVKTLILTLKQWNQDKDVAIPKDCLKITLKAVSRPPALSPVATPQAATQRPPLKLTLPRPSTYPYSTNSFAGRATDSPDIDSAVLSENKLTRRSIDNHVKLKDDDDTMKMSKSDHALTSGQATAFMKSSTVMRFKLG